MKSKSRPFLDTVESCLPREIKHEENGDRIIADQGQHVDELLLPAKIPDAEGDFSVADGDRLNFRFKVQFKNENERTQQESRNDFFHEVHSKSLDVVFIERAFNVLDHQAAKKEREIQNSKYNSIQSNKIQIQEKKFRNN